MSHGRTLDESPSLQLNCKLHLYLIRHTCSSRLFVVEEYIRACCIYYKDICEHVCTCISNLFNNSTTCRLELEIQLGKEKEQRRERE